MPFRRPACWTNLSTNGRKRTKLAQPAASAVPPTPCLWQWRWALGAGLLYKGVRGQPAASTAETALTAAAYTYGINLATRYAVGRTRPTQGQGNATFAGFTNNASQSGFASNHVATAFALVTPFAQQHNMPWLYGLAAATSFGHVQKREHWVSDTVAGAFLGYAVGSLLTD